jgi:predicted HTH transcriptional regulator
MQFEVINEDVVRNNIADAAHSVAMKPDKLAKLLLQHDHLTETDARSMLDYDDAIARRLMNALIKQNAIMRKGSFYPKTKKFIDLLKKMVGDKEKGIPDKNIDAPL